MTRNFTVQEAIERHLKETKPDVSDSTLYNHRSALRGFTDFCDSEEIEDISDIDSFAISDYRLQRMEEVSNMTAYNNVSSVKKFIGWCESRDLIDGEIYDNIIMPNRDDKAREDHIEPETAKQILDYLEKYEYATLYHALFALLWNTGIRIGATRSINLSDVCIDGKYITLEHRPEFDTPLKNGTSSERDVNLDTWVMQIIEDYINGRRIPNEDDHGNEPLFTTDRGRAHRNTLTKRLNALTRPCYYSNSCPHDREIPECSANAYMKASRCPSSVSAHPIRRSAITHCSVS